MDFEFSSKEELFQRIKPALSAKVSELRRLGYSYINQMDIWNYLIENVWIKSKNLMLSDIVNDILHTDASKFDSYLKSKMTSEERAQYFEKNNIEIIWGGVHEKEDWKEKSSFINYNA